MSADSTLALAECPVCEMGDFKRLPTPGHWIGMEVFEDLVGRAGLVRCRSCGLVFVNPRPVDERLQAFYAGDNYSCHETEGSASSGAKADYLLDLIEPHIASGTPRTLLDFGAGGGGFLLDALARGWEVRGFEPGSRGREICRAAGLDVSASIDSLPSGHFGLVTLHHVFEHLTDPVGVLHQLKRLLTAEGLLLIEVPNARSLRATLAFPWLSRHLNADERYRAFPIHLAYYNKETLRRMLARAGWAVDRSFTLGLGLDEFFRRAPGSSPALPRSARVTREKRRVRHFVRDLFLRLGLGENVAVIARPDRLARAV